MIEWYFAYGSNMNPARMEARGVPFSEVLAGQLVSFELCFNKRASGKQGVAYANIGYAKRGQVEGVLYCLQQASQIKRMDPFEGNPVRYSREVFVVNTARGPINAWVYVANAAMLAEGLLPERNYLNHLLAGAQWHSAKYQNWLRDHPCIDSLDSVGPASVSSADGLIYNV